MPSQDTDVSAFRPRLLIVDDNDDNRFTLKLQLEIDGYDNIETADDGQAAVELLRDQEFDLVLLDVMMPKLDGYGVLQHLKARGRLHNLPVVMISALTEISSVVRCIELGADDYLPKPFDPVLLRARVGASLEKKRLRDELRAHLARIEEELESARQLQLSMVPTTFPHPTPMRPVEIFAMMEPAREVGGDLYDFYETEDGKLCFVIGDVSGKGVASALFMVRTKNLIRLITRLARGAAGTALEPSEIIGMVNRELCEDNDAMMFVTLFFCMLDPATGVLTYTNAGHNPPYRLRDGEPVAVIGAKSRPLGVRANSIYETGRLELATGDVICLYTDGITEAANRTDQLFMEQRLEEVLRQSSGRKSDELIKALAGAVQDFVDGAPQSDDITAMAIRYLDASTLRQ